MKVLAKLGYKKNFLWSEDVGDSSRELKFRSSRFENLLTIKNCYISSSWCGVW
jgi:hypothetical protein